MPTAPSRTPASSPPPQATAARRGYGRAWRAFRTAVFHQLLAAHTIPACGTTLPGGPVTPHSRCLAAGRLTLDRLELDHHPPLKDHERTDRHAVCDPTRVQLLCATCHRLRHQSRVCYNPPLRGCNA